MLISEVAKKDNNGGKKKDLARGQIHGPKRTNYEAAPREQNQGLIKAQSPSSG